LGFVLLFLLIDVALSINCDDDDDDDDDGDGNNNRQQPLMFWSFLATESDLNIVRQYFRIVINPYTLCNAHFRYSVRRGIPVSYTSAICQTSVHSHII